MEDNGNSRITVVVVAVYTTKTIKCTHEISPYNIVGGSGGGGGGGGVSLTKFEGEKGGRQGKQCVNRLVPLQSKTIFL